MSPKDGGPAFPSHGTMGEVASYGMSLRDWFAGQVMSGFTTNPQFNAHAKAMAQEAYGWADAMLAEREK